MNNIQQINYKKYISYILIAYAFSFPISKAATNLFEVLALLLWIIEGNWKEKFSFYKKNLLSISILSLILVSLLSILWHGNAETTLRYIAKYRHLLIIFVFYSSFDKRYAKTLISAFLLGMLLSELMSYGIYFELIHYHNILPSDPSPFMSHMTYSTVLAFTMGILLTQLFYENKLHYKMFYILFFLSATTNLFINGGRTGQIIYIVLILYMTFSMVQNKLKAFIGSFLLLLITFSLAYNFSPNFHSRINNLSAGITAMIEKDDYKLSGGRRVALTMLGLETIKDNILQGTGIAYSMVDENKYAKQLHLDPHFFKEFADYHSTYLTISAQLGFLGIIISLLLIYSLFNFNIKNEEYKKMSKLFAITFLMFSFTHNTLHTMNPMVFFALFAGLFNVLSKPAKST